MKHWWICSAFFFVLLINAQQSSIKIPPNAKIGLSLAGGGAKGFAHIGTLKVLDSLGVRIDYIAGTSMGAIVGGLYASGYTGKEIEQIVLNTDFYEILANEKNREEVSFFNKNTDKYLLNIPIKRGKINLLPRAITKGQKNIYMLKELFKDVLHIDDFSQMPIPFLCTGTNLETGKLHLFQKGDLVNSIMASSAYPSLIDPVKIGDSLYIDGAMTLNYPSLPLKKLGMDIVIGVDLNQGLSKKENLGSALSILDQVIGFSIQKETQKQYEYTDINVRPDLNGFGATSYGDKKAILEAGYKEALKYVEVFSQLPKKETPLLRSPSTSFFSKIYKIDTLQTFGSNIFNSDYIQGKMRLKTPSLQTYESINLMIDKLYATNNYNLITYDIVRNNDKNILKLTVDEEDNRFFLKFGLHYDRILKTGLLINFTANRLLFSNTITSLDVVVGDKPRYYFNYLMDNGYIPGVGVYASGVQLDLKNSNRDTYESWNWFRNEIFTQSIWRERYAVGAGVSHDFFSSSSITKKDKEHFINPFVFIKSDTQDDKDFPTKGFFIDAEAKLLDLYNTEIEKKSIQTKVNMHFNFPIFQGFTYRMNLFGGITLGEHMPYYYEYRLGGIFEQRLGNFIKMKGYQFGELSSPNAIIFSNDFQFGMKRTYYVIGHFSLSNLFSDAKTERIFRFNHNSIGISVGYRSPFGQIKFNYSHALNRKRGTFNVILGHWF